MMLPMSMNINRRQMLMPAEWSIDFRGPILGHIEHPQNCFLTACDVDYSGGKDMSFIESFPQKEADSDGFSQNDYSAMSHYPNGVVLNLSFQEILNIDRLRYIDRVAASAKGKTQNVSQELKEFEQEVRKEAAGVASEQDSLNEKLVATYNNKSNAEAQLKLLGPEYEVYQSQGTGMSFYKDQWKIRKIQPDLGG